MRAVHGRWVLVAVAVLASLVRAGSLAGWLSWQPLAAGLQLEPQRGLRRLSSSTLLTLPWTLDEARKLDGAWLRGAPPAEIAHGLERLGRLQRSWFPSDPIGWLNLARAGIASEHVDIALGRIEQAIRRDPTSPYLHRFKALVLSRMGSYGKTLAELAQAEGLAPGYDLPRVDILPGDDQWVRLEGLRRAAALYPRQRTRKLLALAGELRRIGKNDEANATLEPVDADPRVIVTKAKWAIEDGNAGRAVTLCRRLIARSMLPSVLRANAEDVLARALALEGDDAGALRAAAEAARSAPDQPGPYLSLAAIALKRGESEAALRYMHRAWGRAPGDVSVLVRVAEIARRAGDSSDARLALARAVELAPDRADIAARYVSFLLDRGQFMTAALELSKALDRSPDDSRLLRLAARLQEDTSRTRNRPRPRP